MIILFQRKDLTCIVQWISVAFENCVVDGPLVKTRRLLMLHMTNCEFKRPSSSRIYILRIVGPMDSYSDSVSDSDRDFSWHNTPGYMGSWDNYLPYPYNQFSVGCLPYPIPEGQSRVEVPAKATASAASGSYIEVEVSKLRFC